MGVGPVAFSAKKSMAVKNQSKIGLTFARAHFIPAQLSAAV